MVEIARALGKIKTSKGNKGPVKDLDYLVDFNSFPGWRPRRTIIFCSWGAKEYGLIGSYEWIQQYGEVLSQRAIAYLNVDTAVSGK